MTEKELRKMSRAELLQMLIIQSDENTALKEKIEDLEQRLSTRELTIQESGSLAEAALKLSGIFEVADKAVAEYKESVRRLSMDGESVAKRRIEEAEEKANIILSKVEIDARKREKEAETAIIKYKEELRRLSTEWEERSKIRKVAAEKEATSIIMNAKTEAREIKLEADRYWNEVSARLEAFYSEHQGLRELLRRTGGIGEP